MRKIYIATMMLLALTSCNSGKVKEMLRREHKTEPVGVNAIKVRAVDNVTSVRLVGTVEAAKSAAISSQWPCTLTKICVKKGQKVTKGHVLARTDAQGVKSSYDIAKATYDQAKDALERVEKIYGNGSVSETKLLDIRTSYAKAEASLRAAEKSLEDCSIKAPFNGVIGDVFLEEGVQISAMAPIFELLDNSSVEIHASIPENEYSLFSVGSEAVVEIPAAGRTLGASLAVKGIQASALSHSYDLCFKLQEPCNGIMPGMTCKVCLPYGGKNQIVIPASAVKTDSEGRYVWCCNAGTVEKKHVSARGFYGNGIVVGDGLSEGDIVIVEGARKVSSGMKDIKVTLL